MEGSRPKTAFGAFLDELKLALGTFLGVTFGILVVMVSVTSFVDDVDAVWKVALTLLFALGVCVVGIGLLATSMWSASRTAAGWIGITRRRIPFAYSTRERNGARAVADVVLLLTGLVAGLTLYYTGVAAGQLNWTLQGLFLILAGALFGALPLVPRVACFLAHRRGWGWKYEGQEEEPSEHLVVLVVALLLGIGLSFGVSQAFSTVRRRGTWLEATEGEWVTGQVVGGVGTGWPDEVEVTLPKEAESAELTLELEGCSARLERPYKKALSAGRQRVRLRGSAGKVKIKVDGELGRFKLRFEARP